MVAEPGTILGEGGGRVPYPARDRQPAGRRHGRGRSFGISAARTDHGRRTLIGLEAGLGEMVLQAESA
ncbi:hypothetical protein KUM37_10925 [Streptomonospora sp. NEAU-YY374]|nr:hypothetical protein [Streptomonospora nanhaiensis]